MSQKPETVFRKKVVAFLRTLPNTTIYSIQSIAIRGIPDILACIAGRFVAIEIKSDHGKPSALQSLNLARINECGGVAILLYPNNFELNKAILREVAERGIYGNKKESSEECYRPSSEGKCTQYSESP